MRTLSKKQADRILASITVLADMTVSERVGIPIHILYDMEVHGCFPRRRVFGDRVGWVLDDVLQWMHGRPIVGPTRREVMKSEAKMRGEKV